VGIESGIRDPGFVDYLKSRGELEKMLALPKNLATLLQQESVVCDLKVSDSSLQSEPRRPSRSAAVVETRVELWQPQPGTCTGASGELWIDGEYVADFKNTDDVSDLELGDLSIGLHRFAIEDVRVYCIERLPPYPMRVLTSRRKCQSEFSVPKSGRLRLAMTLQPNGRLDCGIR
jgi:hypothetical protein